MHSETDIRQPAQKTKNKPAIWSIGIFTGDSLLNLKPAGGIDMPVISAQQVTDVQAQFVADPFMVRAGDMWHMFFEVMDARTGKGEIGLAVSPDGLTWEYGQIVLSQPFHLSYPYVFFHEGEYFMIPESYEAQGICLYRASTFPTEWELVKNILPGPWVDSSIFRFNDRWWLFTNPVAPANRVLELFHAPEITGPWQRHPLSPFVTGHNRISRMGGRVTILNGAPVRFAQDCYPSYGTSVRAFEITVLTEFLYAEKEMHGSPILSAGDQPWRRSGMHHIDPHFLNQSWLACVDGQRVE